MALFELPRAHSKDPESLSQETITAVFAALVKSYGDETDTFKATGVAIPIVSSLKAYCQAIEQIQVSQPDELPDMKKYQATPAYKKLIEVIATEPDKHWHETVFDAIKTANPRSVEEK